MCFRAPVRYVAFLRAVNVGGRRVSMDRLRAAFQELGFEGVSTYIASGNVVFEAIGRASDLERAIEERQPYLVLLNVEPPFMALHDDPRFQQAVRRIGIPPPR